MANHYVICSHYRPQLALLILVAVGLWMILFRTSIHVRSGTPLSPQAIPKIKENARWMRGRVEVPSETWEAVVQRASPAKSDNLPKIPQTPANSAISAIETPWVTSKLRRRENMHEVSSYDARLLDNMLPGAAVEYLYQQLNDMGGILEAHNITYWIGFGSLLGYVRHGGHIPWDHDLDLHVMEEDYETVIALEQEMRRCGYRLTNAESFGFKVQGFLKDFLPERQERSPAPFIDIFVMRFQPGNLENIEYFYPPMRRSEHFEMSRSDVFPLARCRFGLVQTFCPRRPQRLLNAQYGLSWDHTVLLNFDYMSTEWNAAMGTPDTFVTKDLPEKYRIPAEPTGVIPGLCSLLSPGLADPAAALVGGQLDVRDQHAPVKAAKSSPMHLGNLSYVPLFSTFELRQIMTPTFVTFALYQMLYDVTKMLDIAGVKYWIHGQALESIVSLGGLSPWDTHVDINVPVGPAAIRDRLEDVTGNLVWACGYRLVEETKHEATIRSQIQDPNSIPFISLHIVTPADNVNPPLSGEENAGDMPVKQLNMGAVGFSVAVLASISDPTVAGDAGTSPIQHSQKIRLTWDIALPNSVTGGPLLVPKDVPITPELAGSVVQMPAAALKWDRCSVMSAAISARASLAQRKVKIERKPYTGKS